MDAYDAWQNANTGVIQAMYGEVSNWNRMAGTQKILFALCFRWLAGINHIDWGMQDKPELLEDFKATVATGYKAPAISVKVQPQETLHMPSLAAGPAVPTMQVPDPRHDWDERLTGAWGKGHTRTR